MEKSFTSFTGFKLHSRGVFNQLTWDPTQAPREGSCMYRLSGLIIICLLAYSSMAYGLSIQSPTAVLLDAQTGRVLFAKNADEHREPASVTKILTALVALENATDLNVKVTISANAANTDGSSALLEAGMEVPLGELIQGMLLLSGNDAAVAVAEHISGSVAAFVELMNARAQAAGAKNSRFVNPSGLPDKEQVTTAYDMALIGRAAMENSQFAQISAIKLCHLSWIDEPVVNHNRLLWTYAQADGGKNGYTKAAKHTWVGSATNDGLRLITAVLGAESRDIILADQEAMFDYGFSLYEQVAVVQSGESVGQVPVKGGKESEVAVVTAQSAQVWAPTKLVTSVTTELDLPPEVNAPLNGGESLGELRYVADGDLLATIPLQAAHPVEPMPVTMKVKRYLKWSATGTLGLFAFAFSVRTVNLFRRHLYRRKRRKALRQARRAARLRRMEEYEQSIHTP
jgi:D-alanyl-D-alanine carboxypeptidase (penicillin-binding protein 5/6)